MEKYFKRFLIFIFIMGTLVCAPGLAHAQLGDPGCDPDCNCRSDNSICPIDGGLGILLLAGIGYGIKSVKDTRKKEDIEPVE